MAQLSCDSRSRVLSFNFSVWPHCSETDKCRLLAAEASWLVCISPAVLNSCKSLFLLTPALFSPPPVIIHLSKPTDLSLVCPHPPPSLFPISMSFRMAYYCLQWHHTGPPRTVILLYDSCLFGKPWKSSQPCLFTRSHPTVLEGLC